MPRRRLYLSSRCNGPVVEPTFRGGAKRFRNHPYALVASAGTLPPISRESQPHDARHLPVARCITNSALNAVRTSACWNCSVRTPPGAPMLYHATLALKLHTLILQTLCQCIRQLEGECARVPVHLADVATNPKR
jgi:hypothetical protein